MMPQKSSHLDENQKFSQNLSVFIMHKVWLFKKLKCLKTFVTFVV
jgi:hypothetical protein